MKRLGFLVFTLIAAIILAFAGWIVGKSRSPHGVLGPPPDSGGQGTENGGDSPSTIRPRERKSADKMVHSRKSETYFILECGELRPGEAVAFFQEVVTRFGDDLDAINRIFQAFLEISLEKLAAEEIVAVCEAFPNLESTRRAYFGVDALCYRPDTSLEKLLKIARVIPLSNMKNRRFIYTSVYTGLCMRARTIVHVVADLPSLPPGEDHEGAIDGIRRAVRLMVEREPGRAEGIRLEIQGLEIQPVTKEVLMREVELGEADAKANEEYWRQRGQ
jgi:hypothetical protein